MTDSQPNNVQPVDLSNWRESPHNQWSFHNIDKILKTEVITKSKQPQELEENLRSFSDFNLKLHNGDQPPLDIEGFLARSQSDGLLVLHHGKVVYERYPRQNTQASCHILMSVTKSVCGLIFGILADQGLLTVDDPVDKYVPELRGTTYENVTIRMCLDMRSGLLYADGSPEYRAATDLRAFIAKVNPPRAPDDRFEYVSLNTDLLGWVAERAVADGRTFTQLVEQLIWQPMGAEHNALMTVDAAGGARVAGGLSASLRDLARLGQLVAEGGKGFVPAVWIEDIFQGGDREAFARGSWASGVFEGKSYRSFWVSDSEHDTVVALGIFGQMLFVDRKNGIVMAKTASQEKAIDRSMTSLSWLAWKEIVRILS
ncbi:beta-lactamase/transpeptidase-like protein [Dissoconium aciculare CBS 342.82]|uniref:Beta-lactamase/transpeptidase-like protein n=1 Tax=Dissoconium aciculare CBS 342.82 TaxID=1314786 RepID=A0A6J3MFP7_9PEZI|nr:beta-lactamase/transpeptidase-like protein [Dissoconium aciculare CBS 342.82]KAF1826479.1 beta-lactamase/transpeptidase-like protein [Dissoconium aciculare CBS 342.82]